MTYRSIIGNLWYVLSLWKFNTLSVKIKTLLVRQAYTINILDSGELISVIRITFVVSLQYRTSKNKLNIN